MTRFGEYLSLKSVNKSEVARKSGLSKARLTELSLRDSAHLRAHELYIVAQAIDVSPCEMLEYICGTPAKNK